MGKGNHSTSFQLVKDYISKYPRHGNTTLAKLIMKEHPLAYPTLNSARQSFKRARGCNGKHDRATMKIEKPAEITYGLPKSSARPRKAYSLPQGKTLLLTDIHVPYHNEKALEIALKHGDKYEPDNILLNGDTIDFYSISRWEKDPEVRNLAREIERTRQLVYHIRGRFPKARLIWKNGNHEDRWEAFLWNKAPELIGCSDFEMRKVLRLDENGFDLVHSKQKIKAGKHLTIIHGHEVFGAHNPVNPARTICAKLKVCAIKGHNHQTSEHTERTADDKYIACWSVGCLSELNPDYMPFNNWNHGFATIDLDGNDFDVNNYRIVDGKIR